MFRISAGRIEQIGVSWIKHGNFAASTPGCGACNTTINGARLGPGCRDTYDANYNSFQYGLGPRSDINASSGAFPFPPTIGYTQSGNAIYKRCQVAAADLSAQPAGALFLVEGLIVHPQDAAAGNAGNNAAYRLLSVAAPSLNVALFGGTVRARPAIQAWSEHGLGASQPDPSITLTPVDVPGDGRIWVGSKATDLGGGVWVYEYAVENQNSHRAVGGFVVPVDPAAAPGAFGFHDVPYHSGEPIDGTDWPESFAGGASTLRWATSSFAQNSSANAIRFGTLYNFRFRASTPPTLGAVTLELFRPGSPGAVVAAAVIPGLPPCAPDFNSADGVTVQDVYDFFQAWNAGLPAADFNHLDGTTVQDIYDFLQAWNTGCP
jgi:hypothetical protein